MDETAARLPPRRDTEDTDQAYGELKVAVEDDVLAHFAATTSTVHGSRSAPASFASVVSNTSSSACAKAT